MRFLPVAVLVAMCGIPPPKSQRNGKTVAARYTTDKAVKSAKIRIFSAILAKYFCWP
jgi:hypothetical protein